MAQQQADALPLLAETALHNGLDPGTPGERYQVVVHVDTPVLADPSPWKAAFHRAASLARARRPG
jgi:hypothetical protein